MDTFKAEHCTFFSCTNYEQNCFLSGAANLLAQPVLSLSSTSSPLPRHYSPGSRVTVMQFYPKWRRLGNCVSSFLRKNSMRWHTLFLQDDPHKNWRILAWSLQDLRTSVTVALLQVNFFFSCKQRLTGLPLTTINQI